MKGESRGQECHRQREQPQGRPPGLHEDLKAVLPGPWKEEEEGKGEVSQEE